MSRRVVLYTRISKDREGAGLGVERQRADCLELAERLGWSVVGHHSYNDLSAYTGKARPGYKALLADIDSGRADAVLVWHTDRLHRSPVELEAYIERCEKQGVMTQTVKAGAVDLATPSGRMVARQFGNLARYEVEHMIERQQRAKLQAAMGRAVARWSSPLRLRAGRRHRPRGRGCRGAQRQRRAARRHEPQCDQQGPQRARRHDVNGWTLAID